MSCEHDNHIKGLPLPRLGGNSNNGDKCGGFARNFNNDATNENWNRRGRETIFRDKKLMGEDLAATVRNHITMEFPACIGQFLFVTLSPNES